MAVIKCSLKKDGRLKVVEVLEFKKGDIIKVERLGDIKRILSPDLAGIIPCPGTGKGKDPGRFDCWKCIKSFGPDQFMEDL
jgi:hypothetical protein